MPVVFKPFQSQVVLRYEFLLLEWSGTYYVGFRPLGPVGLENYVAVETPDTLRVPEMGLTMRIVDGPEVNWNFEITRDTIWRNIREVFNRLGIKVFVFWDKIEIRGYIPTEVIDIPRETDISRRGAIICSGGGLRGWVVK